jgi:membrane protein YqaA with SNARE-associated domain
VPRRERTADQCGGRNRDRQRHGAASRGRYNHLFILMGEFVGRIRSLALALGGPGLFLVAFLDSTFLPLPGITDILLVVLVTRHESAMPLYVVLTVAGSVAGCLVMHAIGRKGGDALVRKRFAGGTASWRC